LCLALQQATISSSQNPVVADRLGRELIRRARLSARPPGTAAFQTGEPICGRDARGRARFFGGPAVRGARALRGNAAEVSNLPPALGGYAPQATFEWLHKRINEGLSGPVSSSVVVDADRWRRNSNGSTTVAGIFDDSWLLSNDGRFQDRQVSG
jgi:hypothetical protein